jgi:hypothetical protein
MAISQIQRDSPGRDYYLRKRAVGERPERSAPQPETTTVDLVYRQLLREAVNQTATRTGRTNGDDSAIQRGRLNPYHRRFGQVTHRTRQHRPCNP